MKIFAGTIAIAVSLHLAVNAQETKDWKVRAKELDLSETAIAQLERDSILVTDNTYKQVFSPYFGGGTAFITSDALLNAYHTLYEESIFRLESTNAGRLSLFLKIVLGGLKGADGGITGNDDLKKRAGRRARLVTGIAYRLLDDEFRFNDPELDSILDDETKRIISATGQRMPEWLGVSSDSFMGIDYNRYKPRGFYTRSERLSRYFRAMAWLQSIPFRIDHDEEFLAFLMLKETVEYVDDHGLIDYGRLLGSPDNIDVLNCPGYTSGNIDLSGKDLEQLKEHYRKIATDRQTNQINDAAPGLRILSACQTPGALLFSKTTGPERVLPSGLDVATAMGSDYAGRLLGDPASDLQKNIALTKSRFKGIPGAPSNHGPRQLSSLYYTYLYALQALVDAPESDAPDFMRTTAWTVKSLNTLLGSWAQMRHTWSLQAKQCIQWVCASDSPSGFVEPEPDFFARMADLAHETRKLLNQTGALEPDYQMFAEHLRYFERTCGKLKNRDEFEKRFHALQSHEQACLLLAYGLLDCSPSTAEWGSPEHYQESKAWIIKLANDIENNHIDRHPEIKRKFDLLNGLLIYRWDKLGYTCRRLEVIAHKQLRGKAFSASDSAFIKDFGKELADLMFYEGNSYLNPRDDAPRIVDVYSHINKTAKHLHVGVSRTRELLVLYPWQGQTYLCRGAVMPYYEFSHPTRLNDAEWKEMLDSKNRPTIPEWFAPIVDGRGLHPPTHLRD